MGECIDILVQLYRYLDRDLSETEVNEVKQHVSDCPPCGDHVRFEEGLRRLVRAKACGDCAPPHLRAAILEAWCRVSRP